MTTLIPKFQRTGTTTNRPINEKLSEIVNILDFGFSGVAGADIYASLTAAIASGAKLINIPAGQFTLSATITLTGAIRIDGAGGLRSIGEIVSGTKLGVTEITYTGSSTAISMESGNGNGWQNQHLSNFILLGTSAAVTGIYAGNPTGTGWLTFSSLTNISVSGFVGTGGDSAGIRIGRCLETKFTGVSSFDNKYGFSLNAGGQITTLVFDTCIANGCTIGWVIKSAVSCTWLNCIGEGCKEYGFYIVSEAVNNTASLDFYNCYTESNGTDGADKNFLITADTYANRPQFINFNGGYYAPANNVGNVQAFTCDFASNIIWDNVYLPVNTAGTITASSNTISCKYISTVAGKYYTDVTNNVPYYGVAFESGSTAPARWISASLTTAQTDTLPFKRGVITIQAVSPSTVGRSAVFGINAASTELISGNATFWANTATAGKASVYYSGANVIIQNDLVGEVLFVIVDALCI